MKILILLLLAFIMSGCGTSRPPVHPHAFKYIAPNELLDRYNKKELGRVAIFTGERFNDYANVTITGGILNIDVGNLSDNQGFIFYLPENSYNFRLAFGTMKPWAEGFDVKGGETITYKWDKVGQIPIQVSSMPNDIKIIASGSLYHSIEIDARLFHISRLRQPKFQVKYYEPQNGNLNININIQDLPNIDKLFINKTDKSDLLKFGNEVSISEKVYTGDNSIEIKVTNKQGYESITFFNVKVVSEQEKKDMANKERLEKYKREQEAFARKQEEDRIAREGDGSSEDFLCKKYGLKPLSNGYAECRMRLDFAKAESKRQQEQYEREQAEYERKLAAIEKEKERRKGIALLELSARMLSGQNSINALGSLGTGALIVPSRPSAIIQTITLPGGRMINCTTMGTMTNCF